MAAPGSNPCHIPFPPIWNIPYPRNPFFLGRENELAQLCSHLQAGQATALSQPQAISGLGGIGKTQIAVEYAYQHHQDYQAVLWTRADSHESLVTGYIEIARLLHLPEQNEQDQQLVIKAVQEWLKRQAHWLLILDNADDLTLVRKFLPPTYGGHLLLTTRAQAMGRVAQHIEVRILNPEAGALLLLRRAGLITVDASLDVALAADIALARSITKELGGLPLALDQAGAYIEEARCGLADYQHMYQTQRAKLLQSRGGFVNDHPESVATTWSLSFKRVKQHNPAAADLLRLCAFLAPDAIPEELLAKGAGELGNVLTPVVADAYQLNRAIAALRAHSLISRDPYNQTLTVHRLVQGILRDTMSTKSQHQWMELTIRVVAGAYPGEDFVNWPALERLLPHMLTCALWIIQVPLTTKAAADLLCQAGLYLYERAI